MGNVQKTRLQIKPENLLYKNKEYETIRNAIRKIWLYIKELLKPPSMGDLLTIVNSLEALEGLLICGTPRYRSRLPTR